MLNERNLILTSNAISEVKHKILRERIELDFVIPCYSLHPVNLGSNKGRGIIIYIHSSIDNCVIQINPDINFSEVCFLEIRLGGGDDLLSVACTKFRLLPAHQRKAVLI